MIIYYDTEFTNLDGMLDWSLISAGFVAEDGREWYVEISDFNRDSCSDFVEAHVLPLLENEPGQTLSRQTFAPGLVAWLKTFDQPIELVSDIRAESSLRFARVDESFVKLKHWVDLRIWEEVTEEAVHIALRDEESCFRVAHPNKHHHALYDARLLKRKAELQQRLRQGTAHDPISRFQWCAPIDAQER